MPWYIEMFLACWVVIGGLAIAGFGICGVIASWNGM